MLDDIAVPGKERIVTLLNAEHGLNTLLKHSISVDVSGSEVTIFVKPDVGLTEQLQMKFRVRAYRWFLQHGHDLSVKVL